MDKEFLQLVMESISKVPKAQYLLLSSVHELEAEYFKSLEAMFPFPVYTIGPSIPYLALEDTKFTTSTENSHDHLKWLDSQPSGSVLYIAFGSFLLVSEAQMDEIVAALKISTGIRYFWVAREKTAWLKEKFGDNIHKGLVVPWWDQLKVLSHSSVAGFWSHCGWNSTMEAIFAGAPMLTFPIFYDQFPNSRKIVEDWENGWDVKRVEMGNEVVVTKEEIRKLLKRFMDFESVEGKEVRERTKGLEDICHRAIAKGGTSDVNLDAFIKSISSHYS
ncbi:UDP-glycosyltransferase [Quillaja saponaria]|uniref:UDP-glycosyltransferase n=1 Tax=Quillaja saponaria TaxID=32244 RepID=A0AAD7LTX6_QUISA|nr:UDP-glycosyltransferase [Quillaja saponaria]